MRVRVLRVEFEPREWYTVLIEGGDGVVGQTVWADLVTALRDAVSAVVELRREGEEVEHNLDEFFPLRGVRDGFGPGQNGEAKEVLLREMQAAGVSVEASGAASPEAAEARDSGS